MNIIIFEDEKSINLNPLTLTHPVYELRCGMVSLRKKVERLWKGATVTLHCRAMVAEIMRETNQGIAVNELPQGRILLINGRILTGSDLMTKIDMKDKAIYVKGDAVVAAVLDEKELPRQKIENGILLGSVDFPQNNRVEIEAQLVEYPWDLIFANPGQIETDFHNGGVIEGKVYPNVTLLNEKAIFIGAGATVKPGVVLDAEHGPIYVSENAKIMTNAVIEGPCFIGEKTAIKMGAKIYEGCSFGEVCKIGGEVEESIIHAYSNKQHEGFLGHAYVGEWCNFGADTNNSDLKNNYSNVKVQINNTLVDTGSMFVGLFMGDHSKTGINTMFNTGTVVGVGCNVYGGDFPPRFIPSFNWGGGTGSMVKYKFNKTIDTARTVMARRDIDLTDAMIKVLQTIYDAEDSIILDKK